MHTQQVYDKNSRPVDVGDIVYTPFRGCKYEGRVEALVKKPSSTSTTDRREMSPASNLNYTHFNNSASTTSLSSLGGISVPSSRRTSSKASGPPTDSFPIITADSEEIERSVRADEAKSMPKVVFHDQEGPRKESGPQAGTDITKDMPYGFVNEFAMQQGKRSAAKAGGVGGDWYGEMGGRRQGIGDTGSYSSTAVSEHSPKSSVQSSNNYAEHVDDNGGHRNLYATQDMEPGVGGAIETPGPFSAAPGQLISAQEASGCVENETGDEGGTRREAERPAIYRRTYNAEDDAPVDQDGQPIPPGQAGQRYMAERRRRGNVGYCGRESEEVAVE